MTAEAMRVEALAEQRRPLAAVPTPRSLLDVFDATVAAVPEASAIDAPDGNLSYAQLASETEALASRLRDFGVGAGDRVGVRVASGTADLYVAILAVLRAGAAYVPVDADDPPARAEAVWDAAEVCAVVGDDLRIVERAVPQGELRRPTPSDDAWVIFTSGSTGTPNGVVVTHGSAAALVDAEATLWTVEPGDRVLAGLSVGFDASCEEMWLAWRHGATLVPAPRERVRSGVDLGAWLAQRGITVISTVPTLASLWGDDVWDGVRLL
ncbi:MAG: AMP-binding protein, partial [Actinobacteria bacterium]|nr:AMP-binding protein [Actinomycetota bacterium]